VNFGGGQIQRLEYILKESDTEPLLAKSAISLCFDISHTLTDVKQLVTQMEVIQNQYQTTLHLEEASL
jgi:hypothetical protein